MGTWSGEPFGNDTAADWVWEFEGSSDWELVRSALEEVLDREDLIDEDVAMTAIAAAEVVAHGVGHATQSDAYTEDIDSFVKRASEPSPEIIRLALSALEAATGPKSGLTELWAETDATPWQESNARIAAALRS